MNGLTVEELAVFRQLLFAEYDNATRRELCRETIERVLNVLNILAHASADCVLLESPYAGDTDRNVRYARACMRDSFLRGEKPFASHLMYAVNLQPEQTISVPLTRGFTATIDAGDAERVLQRKWFAQGKEPHVYAARHQRCGQGRQETIYLHRFLLDADEDEEVDHVNGNPLDNRRVNLRIATHQQNSQNTRVRSDNVSGFKGVSAQGARWRANIRATGEQVCLGTFDTAEEAGRVYDAEAVRQYGRFARVNFPVAGVLDDLVPKQRQLGIVAGLCWGTFASKTVVYTDLGVSSGMVIGIERAKELGRPVERRTLHGWSP